MIKLKNIAAAVLLSATAFSAIAADSPEYVYTVKVPKAPEKEGSTEVAEIPVKIPSGPRESFFKRCNVFNNLELGATIGTTGLGLELATPVTKWVNLRAGFTVIPHFNVPLSFGITSYTDGKVNGGNFSKIKDMMYDISGFEIDDVVDVDGSPRMTNFKLLVDVFPIPNNKHWHITLGFYTGPSRVAKAINTMTEMPSLLAIGMYNRLYDHAVSDGFIDYPIWNDIYLDPDQADMIKDRLESYGRLGIHIGDYKDGTPYYMEPDKDGTVKADAVVNRFRYYVGCGYTGAMSEDKRWNITVDAGVMMWGGSPKVINHEGVDMSQLVNVRGKVGDYLGFMKSLAVYPVVELKFSYTFF